MSESASPNGAPRKRARARKSTAKKTSAPEPTQAKAAAKSDNGPICLTAIDRRAMVATAAYYRAERRGFQSGHEFEDWLDAEADIETLLRAQLASFDRSAGTA